MRSEDEEEVEAESSNVRIVHLPPPTTLNGATRTRSRNTHGRPDTHAHTEPRLRIATRRRDWQQSFDTPTHPLSDPYYQYRCLTDPASVSATMASVVAHHLQLKWQGYRQQDLRKGLHDPTRFVDLADIRVLLSACQLQCFYCHEPMRVVYEHVRDPRQWTLERIDNALGHYRDNVQAACLQCNLRRRTMYHERYTRTKQMVQVVKISNT